MCCCLVLQVSGKCRSSRNWASYSSSHKDWSCWAGLHPPSKADAVYAIPSRAPRLRVHQTGSRGGAEARRARAGLARSVRRGCTRRWKRALHVPPRGGAVGGTACRAPTPVAGSGRLAQRGRPGRGSTYLRTAINRSTERAVELKPSAMQCEAHLCGQERNNYSYSKTISPPEALSCRLSSIGYSSAPRQALLSAISYRLSAISYRLSAIGYLFRHGSGQTSGLCRPSHCVS